jgi:hypothetical protein
MELTLCSSHSRKYNDKTGSGFVMFDDIENVRKHLKKIYGENRQYDLQLLVPKNRKYIHYESDYDHESAALPERVVANVAPLQTSNAVKQLPPVPRHLEEKKMIEKRSEPVAIPQQENNYHEEQDELELLKEITMLTDRIDELEKQSTKKSALDIFMETNGVPQSDQVLINLLRGQMYLLNEFQMNN